MKLARSLSVILLSLFLVSCGSMQIMSGNSSETMILHVVRSVHLDQAQYEPFDRTIVDVQAVHHLYVTALALPAISPGSVYSCPSDIGLIYHLDFEQNGSSHKMDLDATGCQFLQLSQTDVRQTNAAFLSLVAQVLQLPSLTTKNP